MPDAVYADPSERLPWLPNVAPGPRRKPQRSWVPLLLAAAAAAAIAAGGWVWLERSAVPESPTAESTKAVPLPAPAVAPPAGAEPEAVSEAERAALRPAAPPEAEPAATRRETRSPAKAERTREPARKTAPPAARPSPYDPRAWQSGIPGRIIQLGAYRTSAQAQSEWRRVYARYPLLRPLSPRVLKSRIRGRTYYRLQLGTFSQAHSELLCQRLRTLGEGCLVLGMPRGGRGR